MSDTTTLTLAEFLLARYAEEEAAAERGRSHPDPTTFARDDYGYLWVQPAHVLADCEAKRRIVDAHNTVHDGCPESPTLVSDDGEQDGTYGGPCFVLRALALPYADHPDFRQEWRP